MKDKIRLLPQKVANQIAAGEVVTHPASVIKEMMENSIDAGATEVIVNYRQGGYELIQVVDDGVGMSPNDARMAFERHATSKIRSANDVYALSTFGFRGEALASIAAVSRVELKSRMEGVEMGTLTVMESGECVDQQPVECEQGSQFCVRNIFHDTPARRRFVAKSPRSAPMLAKEFRRVALCYPQISFELHGESMPIYRLAPTTLAGRIVDVVGRSYKTALLEVDTKTVIVNIRGYIGSEKSARMKNYDQYMFVNGRYFESRYLMSALLKGYEKIIRQPLQPSFFLYFEVSPDNVDVNIHPQKIDVKFAEEESIWNILLATVRETLARTGVVSLMDFDESSNVEIPIAEHGRVYAEPRAISNENYNPFEVVVDVSQPKDELEAAGEIIVEYDTFESEHVEEGEVHEKSKSGQRSTRGGVRGGGRRASALKESVDISWEAGFDEFESEVDSPTLEYVEYESEAESEVEVEAEVELPMAEAVPMGGERVDVNSISLSNGRYAWCKIGSNMSVIDLKRAKERMLFELYNSTIGSGESVSQHIIFPITEQLSRSDYQMVSDNIGEFKRSGFEIELLDNERIMIVGVPAGVKDLDSIKLIEEMIQLLASPESVEDSRREKIATMMAQKGAQNIGRSISLQQARELVSQLMACESCGRTADGRRIIWEITPEDIKRRMK